jgi:uncharacterized protein (TIGR03083 family)
MTDQPEVTIDEFLRRLDAGWAELDAFIESLTPEQLTGPADAAGWTVRDHLDHLAVWGDSMNAVLRHESRRERMGVDETTWARGDFDEINAEIRRQREHLTLDDVLANLRRMHTEFRAQAAALTTDDLKRPYAEFQADSQSTDWVIWRLAGNTFGHYEEHLPWMRAIVAQG